MGISADEQLLSIDDLAYFEASNAWEKMTPCPTILVNGCCADDPALLLALADTFIRASHRAS